jgi:hypothetical protein
MFVYNITIKVDNEIEERWLKWQREVYTPEIMATNLFNDNKIFKLLEQDDADGSTYILQFFTDTKANYNRFINEHAPTLTKKVLEKWGERFIDFRTIMQTVH